MSLSFVLKILIFFNISLLVIAVELGYNEYIHGNLEAKSHIESLTLRSINSKCTKDAIEDIIEICISEGIEAIDPIARKESALRLSICEFKASGVEYPFDCHILYTSEDYSRCIASLEKIPQYWTTFSGNFRDIGRICHEESLPFQKDHIIGLYSNISRIYNEMYENMEMGQKMSEESMQELKFRFDSMLDIVEVLVDQQKGYHEEISKEYQDFNIQIKTALNRTIMEFKDFSGEFENNVGDINTYINNTVNELAELSHAFKDYDFVDQATVIKLKVLEEFRELDETTNDIVYNIIKNLESTSNTVTNNIDLTEELSKSLHNNIDTMGIFKFEVNSNNDLIHLQSKILRSEFEQSVIDFSRIIDEQMESYLDKSQLMIESKVKDIIDDISHDLNETISSLNRVNKQLRFFSNSINNATVFMYQGLRIVTENRIFELIISLKDRIHDFSKLSQVFWLRITKFILISVVCALLLLKITLSFFDFDRHLFLKSGYGRMHKKINKFPSSIFFLGMLMFVLSVISGVYFAIFVSRFATYLKTQMEAYNDFDNSYYDIE